MEEIHDQQQIDRPTKKKKFSLLYVDDEATNLRVFKANFRKFFNVYTSTNPIEAIDILNQEEIQVIVTDQRMPEMTGTQFLEKILPDHPDVIKIILTGFTDIEAIKDGINRCGIFKYITKPWNFDEMKGVLERAIETYQQAAESEEHIKELEDSNVELESRVRERTQELNKINKRLIDSIRYAGLLQQSMLPNDRYLSRQFHDHFVIFETKYLFSEEFVWTTRLNFRSEDYTVVSLIEFDGKGIVGSLKTLIADSVLNYLTHDRKIFHSGEIINELKYELDAAGSDELQCDLKVSVAVFDHNANTLQFSGINQDMIVFNGTKSTLLKGDEGDHFEDAIADKIGIEPDASYYMYSNGYYNQMNEDGVKFSYEKFEEMLKSVQGKSMGEQREFLMSNLQTWKAGSSLNDDISIIGFKL
ncbi:Response regulator receiver domain-containing protein [Ekhidna lutea]|uniref:Response regulator receiver domain-containing protein n=1 Tax=Ekhidna lutea TaxID=447679 RepID=A0A239LL83_EKHLU|nr:response regulator [Ekhidna lutea]SNT30429.1 Response regulator receiver domain-containing protein [Ekhidna lutea]